MEYIIKKYITEEYSVIADSRDLAIQKMDMNGDPCKITVSKVTCKRVLSEATVKLREACQTCKGTGIYIFSDRVSENCPDCNPKARK